MLKTTTSDPITREIKETISLSVPLIGSWTIYSLSGFIGTAMVARLGEDALAASVIVNTLWMMITVFFFGIFSSVSVLVSHQYGARNYDAISKIIGQAFILTILALIPILLAVSSLPLILRWTSQSEPVLSLAIQYANALVWSAPGVIILVALENFLNGVGRTKLSLWISILEVPFEIFLIYIFIFGKLGIPAFGIAGVGYGFAASYAITIIGLMFYLYRARFAQPFQIFKNIIVFNKDYFKELIFVGLPIGIMYLVEVSAFTFATFLMARFNTLTLAAHQIVIQYLGITINIAFAISQAVSIRIGQNVGRQDLTGVRNASKIGMTLSFCLMFIISLIYIFLPGLLLRIDIDIHDPVNFELAKSAASLMVVLGFFQLFDSIRIIETGVLRGLKDTRASMYVSFISFWLIGVVCASIFGFTFHWRGVGIWTGLTCGVAVGAIILFFRLRYMLQKLASVNVQRLM